MPGSNTAASIDETTGMMLSAGHAFCKVNQGGTDATIGYSSGSKFWSSSYLPIPEYVSWCDTFGKKIVNGKLEVKTNTNYDRLPIPTGISKYSNNIIFCFFPENAFLSPPSLRINGTDERIGLLTDADLNVISITPDGRGVVFDFIFGVSQNDLCAILWGNMLLQRISSYVETVSMQRHWQNTLQKTLSYLRPQTIQCILAMRYLKG